MLTNVGDHATENIEYKEQVRALASLLGSELRKYVKE